MDLARTTFSDCESAVGAVVVIDVLRAASTAAYALAAGVARLVLARDLEHAFALRRRLGDVVLLGEVGGLRPPGFDLGNSPAEVLRADLRNATVVQCTGAGTAAAWRCTSAARRLFASFVCGTATSRELHGSNQVSFVVTGTHCGWDGDEDAACADYISHVLRGEAAGAEGYLERVRLSVPGQSLVNPQHPEFSPDDLHLCTRIDRFDFAVELELADDLLVARPI
jgi:2-phosphosulfolactate phosphatase